MAVKEEKYDPGYEAAYGGAYAENPCSFSSTGLSMFPSVCAFLSNAWSCQDGGKGWVFFFLRECVIEIQEWGCKNLSSGR